MCGIVGYVGPDAALSIIIGGLSRLEYRGYDSAGVAYVKEGHIDVRKKKGRLSILNDALSAENLLQDKTVNIGIGHTRWATHGAPSDENSHPHLSMSGKIALVHNGIIENYLDLRRYLTDLGYVFQSETDTEVVAHLVEHHLAQMPKHDLLAAVRETLEDLQGSYALAVLSAENPDQFVAARKDSPLIIGLGDGCNYVASDIPAILSRTRDVLIMEDREVVLVTRDHVELFDEFGRPVDRQPMHVTWDSAAAEKGGYEHFMMKEIHEEPRAVRDTISPHIRGGAIHFDEIDLDRLLAGIDRVRVIACGTALHAGVVGKYLIEKLARIPVEYDFASEFRYRDPIITDTTLAIIISQSGETLDTLAAMREAKRRGARILAFVNVVGSSIAREADSVIYTMAGPEIAVASTKAYNTQLAALSLLAVEMGHRNGTLDDTVYHRCITEMEKLPALLDQVLVAKDSIQRFAAEHFNAHSIFFIGRGIDYALSMESSLKLKEISYIHSEAYPGGELKHGTIALIEQGTLVICPLTQDTLLEKMISNIREVKARGAVVLGIATPACAKAAEVCDVLIELPEVDPDFAPIVAITPAQMFAYFVTVNKGLDVDKPRNLAKSVTVE